MAIPILAFLGGAGRGYADEYNANQARLFQQRQAAADETYRQQALAQDAANAQAQQRLDQQRLQQEGQEWQGDNLFRSRQLSDEEAGAAATRQLDARGDFFRLAPGQPYNTQVAIANALGLDPSFIPRPTLTPGSLTGTVPYAPNFKGPYQPGYARPTLPTISGGGFPADPETAARLAELKAQTAADTGDAALRQEQLTEDRGLFPYKQREAQLKPQLDLLGARNKSAVAQSEVFRNNASGQSDLFRANSAYKLGEDRLALERSRGNTRVINPEQSISGYTSTLGQMHSLLRDPNSLTGTELDPDNLKGTAAQQFAGLYAKLGVYTRGALNPLVGSVPGDGKLPNCAITVHDALQTLGLPAPDTDNAADFEKGLLESGYRAVPLKGLRPGDVVAMKGSGGRNNPSHRHLAVALGNGQLLESDTAGSRRVQVRPLGNPQNVVVYRYVGAGKPATTDQAALLEKYGWGK